MKIAVHNGSLSHELLKLLQDHPRKIPRKFEWRHALTGISPRSSLVKRHLIKRIPGTKCYTITDLGLEILVKLDNPPCGKCNRRIDCLCESGLCKKNFVAAVEYRKEDHGHTARPSTTPGC